MVLGSVNLFAVFNNKTEVCRDNLFFPTCDSVLGRANHHLRNIRRSCYAVFLIKVDNQAGLSTCGFTLAVCILNAVKNHISKRLTNKFRMCFIICAIIPAQADIHSSNNIAIAVSFGKGDLFRHNLNAVTTGCRSHALITGYNLCVFIVDINLNNVSYLASVSIAIINDDLGFNDTRG